MGFEKFEDFVKVAKAFVDFAEEHSDLLTELDVLEQRLLSLYAAGSKLDAGTFIDMDVSTKGNEFTTQRVRRRFQSLPIKYYTRVFDPHGSEGDEVGTGNLIDEILGVYETIKSGITLWGNNEHEKALYCWQHGFKNQWGRDVLSILGALHLYEES